MNLAVEYMGPTPRPGRWRDVACLLAGPVAADAAQLFAADWAFAGTEVPVHGAAARGPRGEAVVQLVPSGPEMATDSSTMPCVTALYSARTHVACVTPYYVPDDVVQHAFVLCRRRGVRTELVMPARSNHRSRTTRGAGSCRALRGGGRPPLVRRDGARQGDGGRRHRGVPRLAQPRHAQLLPQLRGRAVPLRPPEVAAVRGWNEPLADQCPTTLAPSSRRRWLVDDVARLAGTGAVTGFVTRSRA